MNILLLLYLLLLALSSGLYFVFSNTIMKALSDSNQDIATFIMRKINKVIQNSIFLFVFLGPLLLGSVLSWYHLSANGSFWILLSFLTYLLGVFLITILVNVPMNNRLDKSIDESYWPYYLEYWTRFNTVRYLCCLLALIFLFLELTT